MANLFSIFDPNAILGLSVNWFSGILVVGLLPVSFWVGPAQASQAMNSLINYLYLELYATTGPFLTPGGLLTPVALFMYLMLNNFMGLFPYIFTASTHLSFSVALALPLWLGHVLLSWAKTPLLAFAHLVPSGTPWLLMPFMVLIELMSSVIRPITLSVRLAANMVAGHLILTLLSAPLGEVHSLIGFIILAVLVLLTVLEVAVSVIQAYVFSILSTLYLTEVNSIKLSL